MGSCHLPGAPELSLPLLCGAEPRATLRGVEGVTAAGSRRGKGLCRWVDFRSGQRLHPESRPLAMCHSGPRLSRTPAAPGAGQEH